MKTAIATCHSGIYHEFLEEAKSLDETGVKTVTPHLAVAFNAGVWGYQEWEPTIRYLATSQHDKTGSRIPAIRKLPLARLKFCGNRKEMHTAVRSCEKPNQARPSIGRMLAGKLGCWEDKTRHQKVFVNIMDRCCEIQKSGSCALLISCILNLRVSCIVCMYHV